MIQKVDHVGVRVRSADTAITFYGKLDFDVVAQHPEHGVVILRNAAGVEINLIVNAGADFDGRNILMDVSDKRPGWTHVAFGVDDLDASIATVLERGLVLSEGPVQLGPSRSCFLRDPDANVVELREIANGRGADSREPSP